MADAEEDPLRAHLEAFLKKREPPKTFCPSEVARALNAAESDQLGFSEWRDAMPSIRELVWELRDAGECEVLQKGQVLGADVRLEAVRGPIRVRRTVG